MHSPRVSASAMERLVALGSGPLAVGSSRLDNLPAAGLVSLLSACDGFYAFESALHVFPSTSTGSERGIVQWNAPELWRYAFAGFAGGWFCFAEDVFGAQFAIDDDGVVSVLDPETAGLEHVANDIETWAQLMLDDYRVLTGWPVAHDWQVANGGLRAGRRLIPKVPFVLGGECSIDNLYDADAVLAMLYRGDLAEQMRDLPDGTKVTLRVIG